MAAVLRSPVAWFSRALAAFRAARGGNAAIVFAVSLLPMIGIVGLGVDYYSALSYKARLDAAIDSAAIAAITTAKSYISANSATQIDPFLTTNALAAGQAQGLKVFAVNAGAAVAATGAVPAVQPTRLIQQISATATYSARMPTSFGKIFATPTFSLSGRSVASLTMGSYLDFYIALDVSGSMGLPTSNADQTKLASKNPDDLSAYPTGCVFACHFPGSQGYGVARQNAITLRVDSVAAAVKNLISTATATQTLANQYRIGVYPFIVQMMQAAPLSSNFAAANQIFNNPGNPNYFADTYLDSGLSNSATTSMGSGGTHFENVMPGISNYLQTIGNGSSAATPRPFLFIVTDGADNNQTYSNGNWTGSQPRRPNNWGYCQYAQQLGVTVSILYIPYVPIQNPNPSFAGNEDGLVNAVVPYIPGDLQACATPGFFFTANSSTDINNAMQAMFAQALQAARLTN